MMATSRYHGKYGTRIHRIWCRMKQRCYDKNLKAYKNYGGRGISVCEEWQRFSPFYEWAMANGYNDSLTLDRIDVNGNYEPSNCRFATRKEQANNKRTTVHLTFCGKTHSIKEWSEITGIPRTTIQNRVYAGKPVEQVLASFR